MQNKKIYVAGHTGLAGSAIVRKLRALGYDNLLLPEIDLMDPSSVRDFFAAMCPEYVFFCAIVTGGIIATKNFPGTFIHENLMIQTHVLHEAMRSGVQRLFFLGSSCLYPRLCPQPMKEEYLVSSSFEPSNRSYAIGKIAGIEMCWAYNQQYKTRFFAGMPTNLYGPEDDYDLVRAHVLPAMIRKMHHAKVEGLESLTLWGTGRARREFLHSDDFAEAAIFLMNLEDNPLFGLSEPPLVNIGTGVDLSIRELALLIADVVGYSGEILWDATKPDGPPQKLLDVSRIHQMGWKASISLQEGIRRVYEGWAANTTR